MAKSRRKKNEETKRRFEAIKDLMSTFAMSTVAVVAAVTLIPASPKAEIIKAVSLSEEIVYQVNVTDEENALELSSLAVVLENQLEFYEQQLSLGEQSGHFDNLETDTQYRLSVYGNKGFGQERLDTLLITTRAKVGGTILSVNPINDFHATSYLVDVSIYDPDMKYTSITLYYGYANEHEPEIIYSSIDITETRQEVEIFDIFTSDAFHIYLEGTTSDGTETLDEIWVTPPFNLNASIYMNFINNKEIGFFVYNDMKLDSIKYQMNIYRNDFLLDTRYTTVSSSDFGHNEFIIDELLPNTTYLFECFAYYTNPQTLRDDKILIYENELTTLDDYTYTYTIDKLDEFYEVTITLIDPNHYFQQVFYETYDTSSDDSIFLTGDTYSFVNNGNDKSATFTIQVPTTSKYKIIIGIRNQTDTSIREIIDIIIFE